MDEELADAHQDSRNQTQTITDSNASQTLVSTSLLFGDSQPRDNILAKQCRPSSKHSLDLDGQVTSGSVQTGQPSVSTDVRGTSQYAHARTHAVQLVEADMGHDVEADEDELRRLAGTIATVDSQHIDQGDGDEGPGGGGQLPGSYGAPAVLDNYVAGHTSARLPSSFVEKQNKRKWKMPSFLSNSSHKGKVAAHLQQQKRGAGQGSGRAGGEPTVEEYPLELLTSVMEDPVQPSNNPSVLRTTDVEEEDAGERPSGVAQRAVSETGNSSDSFVSIDSQDLTQQIARYSSKKNKSHNDYADAMPRKVQPMFGEPHTKDINEGAEEPHFGA